MNVTVHAAETSIDRLVDEYLPLLLQTAADVTSAWSDLAMLPSLRSPATPAAADRSFAGARSLASVERALLRVAQRYVLLLVWSPASQRSSVSWASARRSTAMSSTSGTSTVNSRSMPLGSSVYSDRQYPCSST